MSDPYLELAYLHDSEVLDISYVLTNPDSRTVIMRLQGDPEMGYSAWEGKVLRVTASGVFLFRCEGWGHTCDRETLDGWGKGVSAVTQAELARHATLGFRVPDLRFTVTLHSGSSLELVCDQVNVEVVAGQP